MSSDTTVIFQVEINNNIKHINKDKQQLERYHMNNNQYGERRAILLILKDRNEYKGDQNDGTLACTRQA